MRRRSGCPAVRGFTLIEVLIATVLVGVSVVATSWAMATAARAKLVYETEQPITATMVAHEIYELAKSLPREPAGLVGATSADQVEALDALIGASFSPPIRADGQQYLGIDSWVQDVDLEVYGLDDLGHKSIQSAIDGLVETDPKLFQLVVTVRDGDLELETFRWFITP